MSASAGNRRTPGRIALVVIGSIVGLMALAALAGGGGLLWADKTQRDSAGYFTTSSHRLATDSYAIVHEGAKIGGVPGSIDLGKLAKIRIRATGESGRPVFVGIARERDLNAYLGNVSHAELRDFETSPFRPRYVPVDGSARPGPPAAQHIWAASATGPGPTSLSWRVSKGTWAVVVMNADGSRGVGTDVRFGANIGYLAWIWGGLFAAGGILLAIAALLVALGLRGGDGREARTAETPESGTYPAALSARLEDPLSRWLWLVKWLLTIPHAIVLSFLWVAFVLLTVVAWFAILITGRYPRGIFEFNLGVMRWTWRVAYYGYSALGTDRYPPFSLGREPDYPAVLDVAYPGELSRWHALVKWLLAIPQLVIVGFFVGGGSYWIDHSDGWGFSSPWSGLIGLLAVIAGAAVLFTGRYPRGLYDVVVGLNRWVLRVVAYAALMTDEYPPFRLDQGGDEPPAATSQVATA